jgi:hypothetical protein
MRTRDSALHLQLWRSCWIAMWPRLAMRPRPSQIPSTGKDIVQSSGLVELESSACMPLWADTSTCGSPPISTRRHWRFPRRACGENQDRPAARSEGSSGGRHSWWYRPAERAAPGGGSNRPWHTAGTITSRFGHEFRHTQFSRDRGRQGFRRPISRNVPRLQCGLSLVQYPKERLARDPRGDCTLKRGVRIQRSQVVQDFDRKAIDLEEVIEKE